LSSEIFGSTNQLNLRFNHQYYQKLKIYIDNNVSSASDVTKTFSSIFNKLVSLETMMQDYEYQEEIDDMKALANKYIELSIYTNSIAIGKLKSFMMELNESLNAYAPIVEKNTTAVKLLLLYEFGFIDNLIDRLAINNSLNVSSMSKVIEEVTDIPYTTIKRHFQSSKDNYWSDDKDNKRTFTDNAIIQVSKIMAKSKLKMTKNLK